MGFFGFGKKNKEKEQEKMKTGLEKTRTGFWGNILNTLTGSVIDDDMSMSWKSSSSLRMWAARWPCVWWTSCATVCTKRA